MHKVILPLMVLGFALVVTNAAIAADEFGERFSTEDTAGLTDPLQPDPAMSLQNIEPAAGEETLDPETTLENVLQEDEALKEQETPANTDTPEVDL